MVFVDVSAGVALDGNCSSHRPLGFASVFVRRSLLGSVGDLSSGSDILGLVLGTSGAAALLRGFGDLIVGGICGLVDERINFVGQRFRTAMCADDFHGKFKDHHIHNRVIDSIGSHDFLGDLGVFESFERFWQQLNTFWIMQKNK